MRKKLYDAAKILFCLAVISCLVVLVFNAGYNYAASRSKDSDSLEVLNNAELWGWDLMEIRNGANNDSTIFRERVKFGDSIYYRDIKIRIHDNIVDSIPPVRIKQH